MGRPALIAAILAAGLASCRTGGHASTDAASDAQDAGPDVEEPDARDALDDFRCCPLGSPSCDCTPAGGSPEQPGGCHDICDTWPEGWVSSVDDSGCYFWIVPEGTPSCSEPPVEEAEPAPEEAEPAPEPADDASSG
jgi:hypothetical protein